MNTKHTAAPALARRSGAVMLADRRRLAYVDYGPREGRPVLFFHGLGTDGDGCPVITCGLPAGVRLICPDRPGMGGSARLPGRSLAMWPQDVAALLDDLQIDRAAIVGWSAGGPHALATAALLPERITGVTVVSGMVEQTGRLVRRGQDPLARLMLRLSALAPQLAAPPLAMLRLQAQLNGELLLRTLYSGAPACDRQLLANPQTRRAFARTYQRATAKGVGGLLDDLRVLTHGWGIRLEGLAACDIELVYGTEDRLVPPVQAAALSKQLPRAVFMLLGGAGHFLLWRDWSAILGRLVARTAARTPAAA